MASGLLLADDPASGTPAAPAAKIRVCAIFAGKSADRSWSLSQDEITAIRNRLVEVEKNLGNVEFVVGQASSAAETTALLEQAGPDAPVLAISTDIFGLSREVIPTVFQANRPVAVFHLPIVGGHDWCLVNPWREAGNRITMFDTSDLNDLERATELLRVVPMLRRSRVLASPPFKGTPESYAIDKVKAKLGVDLVPIADGRYDEILNQVDENAAQALAKGWIDGARQMVEPTEKDVLMAAQASLTLDQLIQENGASGLCVGTCMGWLPRGFPCLGFSQLNDRGIPAACDGDMDCLLTMLIMQQAIGQAGFLGNAGGVDTSRNAFHLSHCSAPLRMEGPAGPVAPYLLRRHAEVRGGAVPEVHYKIGQKLTFTKLVHLETLLVFTGTIIEVPPVPRDKERGCRTELVAEVDNAERLSANWGGGALGDSITDYYASLHRVAYYGDHTSTIRHLGRLLGLKVVQEV